MQSWGPKPFGHRKRTRPPTATTYKAIKVPNCWVSPPSRRRRTGLPGSPRWVRQRRAERVWERWPRAKMRMILKHSGTSHITCSKPQQGPATFVQKGARSRNLGDTSGVGLSTGAFEQAGSKDA